MVRHDRVQYREKEKKNILSVEFHENNSTLSPKLVWVYVVGIIAST